MKVYNPGGDWNPGWGVVPNYIRLVILSYAPRSTNIAGLKMEPLKMYFRIF